MSPLVEVWHCQPLTKTVSGVGRLFKRSSLSDKKAQSDWVNSALGLSLKAIAYSGIVALGTVGSSIKLA